MRRTLPPQNAQFTLPVSIYGTLQHNWHMPELATWNLNLEHQFGQSWVARISYAGNKGTYLASGVLGFNEQNPAIYQPGNSTEANTQQRRINPIFGSVGLFPRTTICTTIPSTEPRKAVQQGFHHPG